MTSRVLRALWVGTAIAIALEAPSFAQDRAFDRLDTNKDGVISREEFAQARERRVERRVRRDAEVVSATGAPASMSRSASGPRG